MKALRVPAVALAVITATLLGACASPAPAPQAATSATAVAPDGVQDPAVIPSAAPGSTAGCGDPTASLAPTGTLPAPGQMPAGSTMARILKDGRLKVGVDQNTYLFGYRDPATGQIVGFDIDIAHAIAKAIFGDPNKIQFIAITSAQRITYVQNGTVDMVADTMTITCDRWHDVDFSTVYYMAGQAVLVPSSYVGTSILSLSGKKVCAAIGSTSITNIAANKAVLVPVAVKDWTDCLVMLQQGEVDAISTDDTILRGLAAQDPYTKLLPGTFTQEPYGLAISPVSPDFVRFVNGVLEQMRSDGEWAAIYTKWLHTTAPTPPAPTYKG
jgi:polar amino acid transport system substrate-binding protein